MIDIQLEMAKTIREAYARTIAKVIKEQLVIQYNMEQKVKK